MAIADIAWLLAGQGTIAANLRPWLNRILDERFEHGYERAAGRHRGHSITRSARTSGVSSSCFMISHKVQPACQGTN